MAKTLNITRRGALQSLAAIGALPASIAPASVADASPKPVSELVLEHLAALFDEYWAASLIEDKPGSIGESYLKAWHIAQAMVVVPSKTIAGVVIKERIANIRGIDANTGDAHDLPFDVRHAMKSAAQAERTAMGA
ncbi:hypothetical protein FHS76_003532 [Ochrobactrum daejeonense]|uniref:Twin-arginine translocation pathway signal n=1 Tax=Brucella daejeonensis TaxID=659015 RepID=A0A7W9AZT0_9HYPH|nr:hypothetical protein [Brucella daejeonensis]MBB5703625.1 hypothetical protein [Brucella daejeonensis]NKB79866.1 hypothetical protein [Brucella daejeonensis]